MNRSERGAALLVVLLMVAGMSTVAVGVLDTMRRSQRLWSNWETQAQAQWYALGAEAYIRTLADGLQGDAMGAAFLSGDQSIAFPLDDGVIAIRVRDAGSCLNVNAVVEGAGETFQRNETGALQLEALLAALDIPGQQAAELVHDLVAWIDTNTYGAPDRDDSPYLARKPGYLTGGQPLVHTSELRAIRGFTPEIVARIRPYVCALPQTGPSQININALNADHAPLLLALTEGTLSRNAARDLLESRPSEGWHDAEAFWAEANLADGTLTEAMRAQVIVEPRYLEVIVDVRHADATVTLTQLMQRAGNILSLSYRHWSVDS